MVARMEPDEAVDALRELEPPEREELLGRLPARTAERLQRLLIFPVDRAGDRSSGPLAWEQRD